jgi:hypothetical protein
MSRFGRLVLMLLVFALSVSPDGRAQEPPKDGSKPPDKASDKPVNQAPDKPKDKPADKDKPRDPKEKEKEDAQARAKLAAESPFDFDRSIRSLLAKHCYRCHNEEKKKGNVNLARDENPRLIFENPKVWTTAVEALEAKAMPPKKEVQPSDADRKLLVEFLTKTLNSLDCEHPRDPGKPAVRRLNRTEYDNSVRELTGVDLHLADDFSPDASSYGFDTIGEALAMSPVLVEQYHDAAKKLLAELVDRRAQHPDAFRKVFSSRGGDDRSGAREIIERFATRAFRRPADAAFLDRLLAVYDKARAQGQDHVGAIRPMLTAVLISPRFLMRVETARPDLKGPYPVDDYDLASRLSYFLWSAPPDDELLSLASRNALGSPDEIEKQARRMLADPRSQALVDNFMGQWLQLRGLSTHAPDAKTFPQFTDTLRAAMRKELGLFLGEVVRRDRPLTEIVDADYTYVNEELARHYGIEGVKGPEMRRVALVDRRRGGVITSAAVLMLQSDPERNNVPRRGNYIAASILGAPPPPPPPDIPALDESKTAGKMQTLRQLLDVHRSKPECFTCHSRIDPLGFSLENFDAIGRWRDVDAGAPVDASGVLPDGKTFSGPVELKQILIARKDEFTRTLTTNLLIYALGRGLQREDDCVVRAAQELAAKNEYRFSSLVVAVVRSFPFRNRRNPDY